MILSKKQHKVYFSLFLIFFFLALPVITLAQEPEFGFNYASSLIIGTRDLRAIIVQLINVFLGFLGIIAIIIVMYGGFMYMTSAGDPQKVDKAKKILINGAIGLGIILSSWGIVVLIFSMFGLGGGGAGGGSSPLGIITGPSALGGGIVQDHYPARGQIEVPRNTLISVTFKEVMQNDTICAVDACNTGINESNIEIFKNDDGESGALLQVDVNVSTTDSKTFVFRPVQYLGSATNNFWYTVRLKDGIKKLGGSDAFFGSIAGVGYEWQFEVSTMVDLIPPYVDSIIPYPDNLQDTYSSSDADYASGSITVSNQPKVYKSATVSDVVSTPGPVSTVGGDYVGNKDDTISVSINAGAITADVNWTVLAINDNLTVPIVGSVVTGATVSLGSGLTLFIGPVYSAGNLFTLTVTTEIKADSLRVGNTSYLFVPSSASGNKITVGVDTDATASNITTKINNDNIDTSIAGSTVTIDAVVAGSAGNSIVLDYISPSAYNALSIIDMAGGKNSSTTQTAQDMRDEPRNVVVQVNFNEAVNPLTTSGVYAACHTDAHCVAMGLGTTCDTATTNLCAGGFANYSIVKTQVVDGAGLAGESACVSNSDCLSGKCDINNANNPLGEDTCIGDYVSGSYIVSNGYKTVEFTTFDKCGVNSCGENVYCLPSDIILGANIQVSIDTSTLKSCGSDNANCVDDKYSICGGASDVCEDVSANKSPQATEPADGVVDMASNSLDGDRDGKSAGPVTYYNKNIDDAGEDSFLWSFWINNDIDLTPPVIQEIVPGINKIINIEDPIEIKFSKLMMSSTLIPDSGYANGKRHLTLIDNNINRVGYWTGSKNIDDGAIVDGIVDKTKAYISHTPFTSSTNYGAEVGEGIKDLYQNCFVPSADDGTIIDSTCNLVNNTNRSCCNGVPTDEDSCP